MPELSLKDIVVRITDNIPEPEHIIEQGGNRILTKGNISVIQGKAKNGKTFAAAILVAVALGNKDFGFNCGSTSGDRVLYIDTEQSKSDTKILIKYSPCHATFF